MGIFGIVACWLDSHKRTEEWEAGYPDPERKKPLLNGWWEEEHFCRRCGRWYSCGTKRNGRIEVRMQ